MLTLYTTALSANGRKTMAVARYLNLPIEQRIVNVYAGEGQDERYRKINPWGKVPTLVDGEFVLWESNAILMHMSEAHGNYVLSSKDAYKRADILRWLFWESSHWQPILTRIMVQKVAQSLIETSNSKQLSIKWQDVELESHLKVLESNLEVNNFVCGDELTIADFSIAGMTTYFPVCDFPYSNYPAIANWIERLNKISSWSITEDPLWSKANR